MKVALLAHLHHPIAEPYAGGMESHTAMVARELVRRGHDVTLFAKNGSTSPARLKAILAGSFEFAEVADSNTRDRTLDRAVRRALDEIAQAGFDIVFNNSLSPLPYTELSDWPMITVLHTPPTLEKVNAVIQVPGWRPGPRHVFVGVSEANSLLWRTKLKYVRCISNGIDLHRWSESTEGEANLAVWSARITPEKGLHLAIDAARKARMRLEFCGPIADISYYDTVIAPLLGEDTIYRGHLNHRQLATQLSRATVFLSTSLWAEPFGLALVEAMACGTPVAALPNGAAQEVVNTEGGVIAAEPSVASLVEAIASARGMDRRRVRANARRFDAQTMMDRYENLMHQMTRSPEKIDSSHIA